MTSELMMIVLQPIGTVKNSRTAATDDYWGGMISEIIIDEPMGAEGLAGIEEFSHAEVIFYFHLVEDAQIVRGESDAERNRILAEAYGADPEFFAFMRSMDAYRGALTAENATLMVEPQSAFFDYLHSPNAREPGASGAPGAGDPPAESTSADLTE